MAGPSMDDIFATSPNTVGDALGNADLDPAGTIDALNPLDNAMASSEISVTPGAGSAGATPSPSIGATPSIFQQFLGWLRSLIGKL